MKKTEFQKIAYSEASKLFLKLFNQGKLNKYSSEAKGNRQKIKYEHAFQRSLAIYFYRTGTIHIYQKGDFHQSVDGIYYAWQKSSDYKDVVATLKKDLTEFINRLNNEENDDFSFYWGHDGFCDFAYETSKFRKSYPEPGEDENC